MAVLNYQSNQIVAATAGINAEPQMMNDRLSKMRTLYFEIPASTTTVAGDIASTFDLAVLPYGRVRVLPHASRFSCSAWGASRTIKFGFRSYKTEGGVVVAEDLAALNSAALDVSAALGATALSPLLKYDLFSREGITLAGQVAGGTIPVGATLTGYLVYCQD